MPLSEPLSLRDRFAGQALPFFLEAEPGFAAKLAYEVADEMLAQREKDRRLRDHEIEGLTRRAETAERSLEIFQASDDYIPRVALTQLWEMLGVKDQTSAVQELHGMIKRIFGGD